MSASEFPYRFERKLRTVAPLKLGRIRPAKLGELLPKFEWVDPCTLLIDAAYQRNVSARSLALVQKIISQWDWARYKPPIVAPTPEGMEIIDGQHTAIAAASHPEITAIPVMVFEVASQDTRAAAFIGHNKDRVSITRLQMHLASVTAGDREANNLEQICRETGVTLLQSQPSNGKYNPGETIAIAAIEALIRRRGGIKARRVLELLRASECAPISAALLRAIEMLLYDPEFADKVDLTKIVSAIQTATEALNHEAKLFAATHRIPYWRALGISLYKRKSKASNERVNGTIQGESDRQQTPDEPMA